MKNFIIFNRVIIILVVIASVVSAQDSVKVGKGSYRKSLPGNVAGPQKEIYKTENITGPIPTTDWCSSLFWEEYSSNHFAHPLAMCAKDAGLAISYPGSNVHAVGNHFFGSFLNEFVLGHSAVDMFPDARVDGYSDWFIDVMFVSGSNSMRLSYGHGSPFVYAIYKNGGAKITFKEECQILSGDKNSSMLCVSHMGKYWGLFGPAGSTWSGIGTKELVNESKGKEYFSLAVLPDASEQTLELFSRFAYSHVIDTKVQWQYDQQRQMVQTNYIVETKNYQGNTKGTIQALYPHQWQNAAGRPLPFTYNSIRGPMKVITGESFSTEMRFPGILPFIPTSDGCDAAILSDLVLKTANHNFANPADTYWAGKQLGSLTNIIPITYMARQNQLASSFTGELSNRLQSWFSAAGNKNVNYFAYDDNWKSLIGVAPSYGTNDQLNDHHFHYGYYIRAAAEIARVNRSWAGDQQWGAMVDMLIRDIASGDREDEQFPFLRCFDIYAGHSWASGHAKFGDGNNQESSSESMNAWGGIILWAMATGNEELRDLGIYLYTTEMNAINSYWFDVNDQLFPENYQQQTAAIVWGGKVDFATWFSAKPEHIVGINLLPIQSGSLYLGLYPEYVKRNLFGLFNLNGGEVYNDWQETLLMYEALASPRTALRKLNRGMLRDKDPVIQAYAYHWISNLAYLGQVNRNISANYPSAVVFTNSNINTYVVYNFEPSDIVVRFSDSKAVTVRAGQVFMTR